MTLVRPNFPDRAAFGRDQYPPPGSVVRYVQRLFVGAERQPVGLEGRRHEGNHEAIEIDQEHAFEIQLARLVADISRVGYIDPSPPIDGDVVGTVEPLVIVIVGQCADRAVALGDRDPPAAAGVGPLGDDQAAHASRKSCRWPARSVRETPWSCRSWGQTA